MVDVLGALRAGLAPHYTVEREIGAGGMARVFLAAERHPPRKVAVKVMNPEVSTSEFRERFIREVELTSRLSHPHIVPILAAEECLFVPDRSEEHKSELQSRGHLVCRLLLEKKKNTIRVVQR